MQTFSIVYWNIWLDNQIKGPSHARRLCDDLQYISDTYNPDCFGLTEVLRATTSPSPFIIDFLQSACGYGYNYFAASSPLNENWLIGDALCLRSKPLAFKSIDISKDSPAQRRGFSGHHTKALLATMETATDASLSVMVAHPMHLRPNTLKDHYEATNNLQRLLSSKEFFANTILGGDFNEPRYMPKSFRLKVADRMYYLSGTITNPTWRNNAQRWTPVRANLDHIYWTKQGSLKLEKFEVLPLTSSDHQPLLASFTY